jgi:hypothetical protein
MSWKDNTAMSWNDGSGWVKVSDHSRAELEVGFNRIGTDTRMVDGTLRRYSVAKKRTWTLSWDNLPSRNTAGGLQTVDGGMDGEDLEDFYDDNDAPFQMQLRKGDGTAETFTVMITDFSKSIVKRGQKTDLWNLSITLEEV